VVDAYRVELISPRGHHVVWVDLPADIALLPGVVVFDGIHYARTTSILSPRRPPRYRAAIVYHAQGDEVS
jgi:hypothetical protein